MKAVKANRTLEVVAPFDQEVLKIPHYSLVGFCLTVPSSVFLSKLFFVTFLLGWLYEGYRGRLSLGSISGYAKSYVHLSAVWVSLCILAAFIGLNLGSAIVETLKTTMYLLFPLAVYHFISQSKTSPEKSCCIYLWLLLIGQTATSLHTILFSKSSFLESISPPGAVTESGQLALVIPAALALLVIAVRKHQPKPLTLWSIIGFSTLLGIAVLVGHWSPLILDEQRYGFLALSLGAALLSVLALAGRSPDTLAKLLKLSICIVFLVTAVLLNLKRGPWMGLSFSLIVIGLIQSRRGLLVATFSVLFAMLVLAPTSERIGSSSAHFNTSGGRAEMWSVGFEIAKLFPLGVGLDNSEYMQVVNPFLPESHKHMHNNFINVLVETGWIGLVVFCLWVFLPIRAAYAHAKNSVVLAHLAAALAAWNVAGLVEYNFGDSEVRMIAFLFIGMILSAAQPKSEDATP